MDGTGHDTVTTRKPRLALMGEFSAGKSTLSNLLLGCAPLPTRVTATRLPPVWISFGDEAAFAIGHDGSETAIDLTDFDRIDLAETRLIRLFLRAELLELCDLIDMPGISDPNMSADVWQSVFSLADCVVWCTHATQAWRQSEAATWESLREVVPGESLLLITQFDKLASERDQARVLARVTKETEGLFGAVYPVSLLKALKAGDDADMWEASGAGAFTHHLIGLLLEMTPAEDGGLAALHWAAEEVEDYPDEDLPSVDAFDFAFESLAEDAPEVEPEVQEESEETIWDEPELRPVDVPEGVRIMPKRVRARGLGRPRDRQSVHDDESGDGVVV